MVKVREQFKIVSDEGNVYKIKIVNINEYREADHKYLVDLYMNDKYLGEGFFGDSLFDDERILKEETE
ncbi:hypothetical protein FQ642_08420 [Enterococcus faecium]|nr:hypothetical protein [Enterococcus faecium]